jgi:hypothetical protein
LLSRIKIAYAFCVAALLCAAAAPAFEPSVAQLDSAARATGNRRDIAERIGLTIFATPWPAEVSQISANQLGGHLVVGVRVVGVKFHRPLSRTQFVDEVTSLVNDAFTASPETEEVDLWVSVPIDVAKGVVVSGDLAVPTSRTVFSLSARRGESAAALRDRIEKTGDGIFWDPEWSQTAFAS